MRIFLGKTHTYLIRFVQLQLVISLVSLPFLIAWGLPFSLLSPIGNLVFSPVLTLFLLLSSLLFFTELLYIPNTIIAWALNHLTTWWLWALEWHSQWWLIGFAKPAAWLFILMVAVSILALYYVNMRKPYQTIVVLGALCIGIYGMLQLHARHTAPIHNIACNNGTVTLLHIHNQTVVIDPGFIGRSASAKSWAQYTLAPYLIQTTGSLTIDHLIVLQPSSRTFEALYALASAAHIKKIYIPWWQGTLTKSAWHHFFALRTTLQEHGSTLLRLGNTSTKITLGTNATLHITPLPQHATYQQATFPLFCVSGQIDKESFEIYSAKHTITQANERK